jgi:subtilisin family serine protease
MNLANRKKPASVLASLSAASILIVLVATSYLPGAVEPPNDVIAAEPSAGPQGADIFQPQYVPGEVIVKLKDGTAGRISALSQSLGLLREDLYLQMHQATLSRLEKQYGMRLDRPVFRRLHRLQNVRNRDRGRKTLSAAPSQQASKWSLLPYYVLKTDRRVLALCAELNADPDVDYAQPNYTHHICRTPNDPDFPDQYAHQLIQMEDAWEIETGSRDVVVAVIDTGVDVNHPDLRGNIWVNEDEIPDNEIDDDGNGYVDDVHGWNFGDDNNEVTPIASSSSIESHGTQVAGVIAAVGDNDEGVCGVNWASSIMALRMGLDFESADVAEALEYAAANGARVVNMSFGGDVFGPEGDLVMKAGLDSAYEQGVLLVASAGNEDTSRPLYPAAFANVMAVSSTNGEDLKTGHSTFGVWVDIAAPGTDIVTTTLEDDYVATAGTSFSSPYVGAVAALLFAYRPEMTNIEARAVLENTTDPVYYGDVDPNQGYLGTGRVNAYKALTGADNGYPLGEIVSPWQNRTFANDGNDVEACVFVHGDDYQLDYRLYGQSDWIRLHEGGAPADPNGRICSSMANPGIGTYELRLVVSRNGFTHIDRKFFAIELAPSQAHWPRPDETVDTLEQDEYFVGSPLCTDVTGDGQNEIVQLSLDLGTYYGDGIVNIWTADGNSLDGWPVEMGYIWPSSAAVGDIDGDADYEVVVASEYDAVVAAYHVESGKMLDGDWPISVGGWYGFISAGPVLADLDGDGDSEIIVALDAESRDTDGLYAIQHDGSFLWQRRYTSSGPLSVADFDADGNVEITLSGYGPGLSRVYTFVLDKQGQQLARWRGGSPKGTAVADLDADGTPEIIFCTDDEIVATHADGSTLWTTRVPDPLDEYGALSVGDVDSDGYGEVYLTTYIVEADDFAFTRVYALDHRGRILEDAGYPKVTMGYYPYRCPPLIADIDGDGQKEVIVAVGGEPVIAWEADGSVTTGFPLLNLALDYEVTPAIEDLDLDGDLEFMAVGDDYRFHVLDIPAGPQTQPGLIDWGLIRHDAQNSGWTLPSPMLDRIDAPAQIKPGERLELQVATQNPAGLPIWVFVGNLPEGAYYDPNTQTVFWKPAADQAFGSYRFSFLVTDGIRQNSRSAVIAVVPNAIYSATMDNDPNWQLDAGWAWGKPTGDGSWNGDPNSAHTGENVIGYELSGDYENSMLEAKYATVGPIDCSGYRNITISFWRWLGLESPYDDAAVQVSNDGTNWTDIWKPGYSHISDQSWQLVEYAVPAAVADEKPAVYFRWAIGPTDETVTYPGWNIDDVQISGEPIR